MATQHKSLASKFAPKLCYVETADPFRNISPELMIRSYWRARESSVSWADVCIQYIAFFEEQKWEKSILDPYLPKSVGNHPNDYVPIFLYLKNEKPVKAVFDIWHYDIVGEIDDTAAYLHEERALQFQVRNFYRGLKPLKKTGGYECFNEDLELLDQNLLEGWYEGRTLEGNYVEAAKFVIVDKLIDPFQEITTFRDQSSLTGSFIEAVIYIFKLIGWGGIKIRNQRSGPDISFIASKAIELWNAELWEKQVDMSVRDVRKGDVEKLVEFIRDNIFEEPKMLDFLKLPNEKIEKAIDILNWKGHGRK